MWFTSTFLLFVFSSTLTVIANKDENEPNLSSLHVVYRITKGNSNPNQVEIAIPLSVATIIPLVTTDTTPENPKFNNNPNSNSHDIIKPKNYSKDYSHVIYKAYQKIETRDTKRLNKAQQKRKKNSSNNKRAKGQ